MGGVRLSFFSPEEVAGLEADLISKLEHARGFAKVPFIITSGKRTPQENQAVDGVMDSAHVRGLAVDLACQDSRNRMRMVAGLVLAGFNRIGLYSRHIHADVDGSLPKDVLWLGGDFH